MRRSARGTGPEIAEGIWGALAATAAASRLMVGASKRLETGSSRFRISRSRPMTCMAWRECAPRSKKLSFNPTSSRCRTSRQTAAIFCSNSLRGATNGSVRAGRLVPGRGKAL